MLSIRLAGLGQLTGRIAVLQSAITHVLNLYRIQAFPTGGAWTINLETFNRIVARIVSRANETLSPGMAVFLPGEVATALVQRGYKPGSLPIVREPAPATQTATIPAQPLPTPIVAITPKPTQAPARSPGSVMLPVIVPPSPQFPEIQLPTPKESNMWLWIGGILALYLLGRHEKPHRSPSPMSGQDAGRPLNGLSGETANCLLWQEVEGKKTGSLLWRCLKYAPACVGKSCKPETFKFQTRTCIKTKRVPSKSGKFKSSMLERCAEYSRVCTTSTCLPEPFEKPAASPGHAVNVNRMARDLAKDMADDRNATEEIAGKALGREIRDRGGIRPYRGRSRSGKRVKGGEEYAALPLFMRRKDGLPLDEMAGEMGFEDDTALLEAVKKEYPRQKGKKKRQWSASDFLTVAEGQVWDAIDAGNVSGLSGAPQYVWQSTLKEFTERPRKGKDPALPDELNWILEKTKVDKYTGHERVFRGTLPGHMEKRLRDWLWDRYDQPDRWLEDKRIKISFRDSTYHITHPYYDIMVRFSKGGSLIVTESRANYHADSFIEALAEGKPIPKAVLAEYAPYIPEAKQALDVSGLGQGKELFPKLKRELVLENEDIATSDDPLDIFLQRKGWDLNRVRELQDSIAEKAVPDMFTKEVTPLTAGEVEFQRAVEEYMERVRTQRAGSKKKAPAKKKPAKRDPFWIDQPTQPAFLGLGGMDVMTDEQIAQGVRKAVKQDAQRKTHGDTSLNAFYISPDLEIFPWHERKGMKLNAGNASVHSHSAENYNYLRQLTGKLEPPERFSKTDLKNFRDRKVYGTADANVLINGDGRMVVLRCPDHKETLTHVNPKGIAKSLSLPKGWREKAEYKDMTWNEAMLHHQKKYLKRRNCEWTDTEWKPRDLEQPMLFKTMPNTQQEFVDKYMQQPDELGPLKGKGTGKGFDQKTDLTKEFWIRVDTRLYSAEPTQSELFTMPQRTKKATTGEKRITMGPKYYPRQMRLLGR